MFRRWTLAAAAMLAVYLGAAGLSFSLETPASVLLAIIFLAPIMLVAGAGIVAMGHTTGKQHRLWRLVGIMGLLFLASDGVAALHQATIDPLDLDPWLITEIGYVVAYLSWVPIVMLVVEPFEVVRLRRTRSVIDVVTMLVFVFSVALVLLVHPLVYQYGISFGAAVWEVLDAVAAAAAFLYVVSFNRSEWRVWEVLLVGMFVSFAVGDVANALLDARQIPRFSEWSVVATDAIFMTGYLSMGLAAIWRTASVEEKPAPGVVRQGPRAELDLPHWPGVVAQISALVGILLLLVASEALTWEESQRQLLLMTPAVLAALVVVRGAIVSLENRRLLADNLVDPLTGLGNVRHYREQLAKDVGIATKRRTQLSVAMIDVDGLDAINLRYGNAEGDRLLAGIADVLRDQAGASSTPCRVGGDHFAVIMPGLDAMHAYGRAVRIQAAVASIDPDLDGGVDTTIGLATLGSPARDADELDRQARGALYWAKQNRRGEVLPFDPSVVEVSDVQEHIASLEERSQLMLIEVLATAVDARDHYTRNHSQNVADLAVRFAEHLGFDAERVELLRTSALLHDLGKIGVPDAALQNPERLTSKEMAPIKEHPDLGARILRSITRKEILPWIRAHHEHWDGTGYPLGLNGQGIPIEARILALCDAYDTMTSDRPHREGLTRDIALRELEEDAGTRFDPDLVARFVEMEESESAA